MSEKELKKLEKLQNRVQQFVKNLDYGVDDGFGTDLNDTDFEFRYNQERINRAYMHLSKAGKSLWEITFNLEDRIKKIKKKRK